MLNHLPVTTDKQATFRMLQPLADGLEKLFHPFCEVVIHDFSDFERSIIYIAGSISNRSIGGAATDLLLARASSGDTDEDLHNYLTSLHGGRLMKSSTVFLRDETGKAYGAFCVNVEMTQFVQFHKLLGDFFATQERGNVTELLSDDFTNTVQSIITETIYEAEKPLPIMTREDKIDLIARLDAKGVFQVKRAVPIIADHLGLSRATVYNYLAEARGYRNHHEQE
jgi:predicted transcriptional regulator YheO